MTIQEATKKSVEGGWNPLNSPQWQHGFLDPLYWQCLGKTLGWGNDGNSVWLYYQHRFIDHLAEGKSIESYFETL